MGASLYITHMTIQKTVSYPTPKTQDKSNWNFTVSKHAPKVLPNPKVNEMPPIIPVPPPPTVGREYPIKKIGLCEVTKVTAKRVYLKDVNSEETHYLALEDWGKSLGRDCSNCK